MDSQIVTVTAALMLFTAAILVYVGYRQFTARASSPEMEDRLERYATVGFEQPEEASQRAGAELTDRIDRAVKNKSIGEQTAIAAGRSAHDGW